MTKPMTDDEILSRAFHEAFEKGKKIIGTYRMVPQNEYEATQEEIRRLREENEWLKHQLVEGSQGALVISEPMTDELLNEFDECAPACGCEGGEGVCPRCELDEG